MNREQEKQIVGYYSTTDKYIRSDLHSNTHQTVFVKENDKYQWIVLEQKFQNSIEVRQTDSYGKITTWDSYEFTGNVPKCVSMERLQKDLNIHIHFSADEINLIYQFAEQDKEEMCAAMSKIMSQTKDSDTKQTVSTTLKKIDVLSEQICAELIATTKRQKVTKQNRSIKARLAKAKEQLKEPTVAKGKQYRIERKGKTGMEL